MPRRIFLGFFLALFLNAVSYSPDAKSIPQENLSLRDFTHLITNLSEPEGYFDSDNFVSNERAYLKILPDLEKQDLSGGAYIGVGPDQNYSYIAHLKPQIAFIIDIRRQNALQHLYFKALFQLSTNRTQYLERLFGRKIETFGARPQAYGISDLLHMIDASNPDASFAEVKLAEAIRVIRSWNPGLSIADYEAIRVIAQAFTTNGPDLKFTSFNRPARSQHPSYRQLLEETDADGTQSNYLASEELFLLLKKMHWQNRIVPVIGDLAGPSALIRIGDELRRRKTVLNCFYVSNVEFYLFGRERWNAYIRNLTSLPYGENACLIRSYVQYLRPDGPLNPGYYMGTTFQPVHQFLADERAGKNTGYWDLISRPRQR